MGVETTTLFFCSILRFPVVFPARRCFHFPIYTAIVAWSGKMRQDAVLVKSCDLDLTTSAFMDMETFFLITHHTVLTLADMTSSVAAWPMSFVSSKVAAAYHGVKEFH